MNADVVHETSRDSLRRFARILHGAAAEGGTNTGKEEESVTSLEDLPSIWTAAEVADDLSFSFPSRLAENLPKDSHPKKVRHLRFTAVSERCEDSNLGAVALFMVILALALEARLGRGAEETADFLCAGILFDSRLCTGRFG